MDLEHQFTVSAPIDTAWATMMDIEGVAECFPGATLTSADGDSFEGTVKVKLGPIALVYKGSGAFAERDDTAHRAVIEAKGKDKRGNGTAGATVTMSMEESGSQTSVTVVTDLNVTGKPAQFGRGVMQDVSDTLLGKFVDCLATKVAGPQEAAEAEPAAQMTAEPAKGGEAASRSSSPDSQPATSAPAAVGVSTSNGSGPAANGTPTSAAAGAAAQARASRPSGSETLDLGAAVMPAVMRSYAPYAVVGFGALVLGWLLGRGCRRGARRAGHEEDGH